MTVSRGLRYGLGGLFLLLGAGLSALIALPLLGLLDATGARSAHLGVVLFHGWLALAFGASLLTHPLLWFGLAPREQVDGWLLLAEAAVATVEALLFFALWAWRGAGRPSALRSSLVSLVANALSFALGLLFFR